MTAGHPGAAEKGNIGETIEPRLHVRFSVTAYNESIGGYGDNRSRDFSSREEAIAYARSVDQEIFRPRVTKVITMDPIHIPIDYHA